MFPNIKKGKPPLSSLAAHTGSRHGLLPPPPPGGPVHQLRGPRCVGDTCTSNTNSCLPTSERLFLTAQVYFAYSKITQLGEPHGTYRTFPLPEKAHGCSPPRQNSSQVPIRSDFLPLKGQSNQSAIQAGSSRFHCCFTKKTLLTHGSY